MSRVYIINNKRETVDSLCGLALKAIVDGGDEAGGKASAYMFIAFLQEVRMGGRDGLAAQVLFGEESESEISEAISSGILHAALPGQDPTIGWLGLVILNWFSKVVVEEYLHGSGGGNVSLFVSEILPVLVGKDEEGLTFGLSMPSSGEVSA